jgi:acylphosphatase
MRLASKRIFFEGRVQGVGFRFSAKELATGFDVIGTVKNLPDGRVQIDVQGDSDEIEAFKQAIFESHLRAHITRHIIQDIPPLNSVRGFSIKHG